MREPDRAIRALGKLRFLAVAALAADATAASAQSPDHETWRCNQAYSYFDALDLGIGPETRQLSGEIDFRSADLGPKWRSHASIGFTDTALDDSSCHCNGIDARVDSSDPSVIHLSFVIDGYGDEFLTVPLKQPVKFKLWFVDPRHLKLQVGGYTSVSQVAHAARNSLHLACSGVDVSFRNVEPQM